MSYYTDLDELDHNALIQEIDRRIRLHRSGKCDYCEQPLNPEATFANSCRFIERHNGRVFLDESRLPWN